MSCLVVLGKTNTGARHDRVLGTAAAFNAGQRDVVFAFGSGASDAPGAGG